MRRMSRIVFMGTPEFAVPVLQALIETQHVVGVVTQPDKPAGRGRNLKPSPVKVVAEAANIPVFQPKSLRKAERAAQLRDWEPDLIVVAAFGQILRPHVLDLPPHGCLNVHASLLPRWRGASPIQHAILAGDAETGISLMQMDAGLDTGPVFVTESVTIAADETASTLHDKLANLGGTMIRQYLDAIIAGDYSAETQDDTQSTYAPMISKDDGAVDWSDSAEQIDRLIRAMTPWPGTYTFWDDVQLKILDASVNTASNNAEPGTISAIDDNVIVATGARITATESRPVSWQTRHRHCRFRPWSPPFHRRTPDQPTHRRTDRPTTHLMNILVFGAGAVGSYVGGHLAQREHNVTLVMRGRSAASVARHGLTITEAQNKRAFTVYPYAAPSLSAAIATGTSYDLIILGMKSYDLNAGLVELSEQIELHPSVLTLQNGIGIEKRVQRELMPSELIAGSLTTPVKRDAAGGISVEKSGRGLAIAPTRKGQSIRQWQELFNNTQLNTMKCDDAQSMKWSKALLNIVANATSAILDWHPRRIYENDMLFDLEVEMLRETLAVMKKRQIKVIDLPGSSARQLAAGLRYAPRSLLKPVLVKMVGGGRGDKMPSFHVDLYAGKRKGEVLYHNGAIAKAGWKLGIATPVNTTLTEILLQLIKSPDMKSVYRDNPQELLDAVAKRRAMGHQR